MEDQARLLNDAAFLDAHVQRCRAERGRPVNVIAVNFVDIGDVVGATARANGLAEPPAR
ncbi:MAG: hypothetical protein R2755_05505 [Acidimicrobiales bacterium]